MRLNPTVVSSSLAEGHAELAKLARRHMRKFITTSDLDNFELETMVEPFNDTIKSYASTMSGALDRAFLDRTHQEQATVEYHNLVRQITTSKSIIVHDDIAWSCGMVQAWSRIQEIEAKGKTSELHLGGRPSTGIVFLDTSPDGKVDISHQDGGLERLARRAKRRVCQVLTE